MSAYDRMTPRAAAGLVFVIGALTIVGALTSQHMFGLVPCKLCLQQRQPYYVGVPLAAILLFVPLPRGWLRGGLAVLALGVSLLS